jgi:hypothetical protein
MFKNLGFCSGLWGLCRKTDLLVFKDKFGAGTGTCAHRRKSNNGIPGYGVKNNSVFPVDWMNTMWM